MSNSPMSHCVNLYSRTGINKRPPKISGIIAKLSETNVSQFRNPFKNEKLPPNFILKRNTQNHFTNNYITTVPKLRPRVTKSTLRLNISKDEGCLFPNLNLKTNKEFHRSPSSKARMGNPKFSDKTILTTRNDMTKSFENLLEGGNVFKM